MIYSRSNTRSDETIITLLTSQLSNHWRKSERFNQFKRGKATNKITHGTIIEMIPDMITILMGKAYTVKNSDGY
jgi:hypothetical protein